MHWISRDRSTGTATSSRSSGTGCEQVGHEPYHPSSIPTSLSERNEAYTEQNTFYSSYTLISCRQRQSSYTQYLPRELAATHYQAERGLFFRVAHTSEALHLRLTHFGLEHTSLIDQAPRRQTFEQVGRIAVLLYRTNQSHPTHAMAPCEIALFLFHSTLRSINAPATNI